MSEQRITTLQDAARHALEALEELNGWQSLAPPLASQAGRQAAINLRAALTEPHCATQDCMPSKCSIAAQNTELDRTLCEMEHALTEADAIMEEVDEETADAWRKRWGHLWGRTV